ncbi:hypothetical protein CapIbe_005950 [Capra ibex]
MRTDRQDVRGLGSTFHCGAEDGSAQTAGSVGVSHSSPSVREAICLPSVVPGALTGLFLVSSREPSLGPVAAGFVQLEDWTQATWTHLCSTPASCPNRWEMQTPLSSPGASNLLNVRNWTHRNKWCKDNAFFCTKKQRFQEKTSE